MQGQLPKSVVAIVLGLAVAAIGLAYYALFFRPEPAYIPPEQKRMDEILARTGGDVSKMTAEEREFLKRVKVPGQALKP
ncbi:MAG: hypothetical protein N2109_09945 [Fimbriimonadales bacterium]|nr:hypothetical protein [Fimbriimonadales bacterium]